MVQDSMALTLNGICPNTGTPAVPKQSTSYEDSAVYLCSECEETLAGPAQVAERFKSHTIDE